MAADRINFSKDDAVSAAAALRQQAEIYQATAIRNDGVTDIIILAPNYLKLLRLAAPAKTANLAEVLKQGGLSSPIPQILTEISCKLDDHAESNHLTSIQHNNPIHLQIIRGDWANIPPGFFISTSQSSTGHSIDLAFSHIKATPKAANLVAVDCPTTYRRWIKAMMDMNAIFEDPERIRPHWNSFTQLLDTALERKWIFLDVRRIAMAALRDHARAMKRWAVDRGDDRDPPTAGALGPEAEDMVAEAVKTARDRPAEVLAQDSLYTGKAITFPPTPTAPHTSAQPAARYAPTLAQGLVQPLFYRIRDIGLISRRKGQVPFTTPTPTKKKTSKLTTKHTPDDLSPAQRSLPCPYWCSSFSIDNFRCAEARCEYLCTHNMHLPTWNVNGDCLNLALNEFRDDVRTGAHIDIL
jgi:hypothetical protein